MSNYDELLKELEQQEKDLQFLEFTNETALRIGLTLIERAKRENKSITIDINRNDQQLFHYSCEGISPDNDQWVIRKSRVVSRFYRSSYYITTLLSKIGKSIEDKYKVSSTEYATSGGAFPITIKNIGVIGTIAVSGMSQVEDHDWVVYAIKKHL